MNTPAKIVLRVRELLRKRRQRKHLHKRLATLKLRKRQYQADLKDLAHWPEKVKLDMCLQIILVQEQIDHIERQIEGKWGL